MLTSEVMGLWGLSLSWLTALLVALDLGIEFRKLGALAQDFRAVERGRVICAELARHEIEQRVRRLDGQQPSLGFWDRAHHSHVLGGRVELDDGTVDVEADSSAEVWTTPQEKKRSAVLSEAGFDSLSEQAKGKGALRTVVTRIVNGDAVWMVGARREGRFHARVVASFDPRTWVSSMRIKILLVVALDWVWVALGTALAVWKPHFGALSTAGALLLLAHFLGITPIAVAVREQCRTPALSFLRGIARRDDARAREDMHTEPSRI